MAYDIRLDNQTADGARLATVMLRHEPDSADKIVRIAEDMAQNGWTGRQVILADAGDHHIAFTGSHRLAACINSDTIVEAVMLPEMSEDEWGEIESANDDDDLLKAFRSIAQDRDDMADVVSAMEAEVEANNR